MAWALIDCKRKGYDFAGRAVRYTLKEKCANLPRVLPFLVIIAGTLYVLYGGIATPSEAAGAGAFLTLAVVVIAYRLFKFRPVANIFTTAMREGVKIGRASCRERVCQYV